MGVPNGRLQQKQSNHKAKQQAIKYLAMNRFPILTSEHRRYEIILGPYHRNKFVK